MKKIYGILCIGMVFSASMLCAQPLSGAYTIDNTLPVSSTNFTSFTQFASTLTTQGVSGPVTVNVGVASGPYTEQIEIGQYSGASATNTVAINGNGRTITFNATSGAKHTILLSGADYMIWNNLRVIGTNGTDALVVHLWKGADNNTFNNMYIEAPFNGSSTTQVPFSISGSSVSATSTGTAGNMNVVNTSTIIGGYYNTVFYGNTVSPFNTGNEVRNSVLRDFYVYGFYNAYCINTQVRNNIIDRVNRTTISSTYAIYLTTGTNNTLVDGNHIRAVFTNNINNTNVAYLIYVVADATATTPNLIRNNVVSDINSDGTIIGIYLAGSDYAYAENNTVSIDYAGSTLGAASYGIYSTGAYDRVRNNNISISRGGPGNKWGLYYTTAAANMVSDYNNVYIGNTTGTYGFGYSGTSTYVTLANWRTATGHDMNSVSADPQYANPSAFDYSPTNVTINNKALTIGLMYDVLLATRSHLTPDVGAYEFFNTPCSGTPPGNSFIVPSTSLCPGAQVALTLQNTITYTNSGYTVQWYSSPSSTVGPFTAISGATLNSYFTAPITGHTHYQAVITCAASTQSITTPPGSLFLMPTIQDTVPYYESFELLGQNGFPNCNWTASSINASTRVSTVAASGNRAARTGTNYAYFANKPMPNYFYSNQVYLKAGITYSAALWYITENVGYNPWAELSILIGTGQNPNGQVVATKTPVTGQLYNLLSNTFSVTSTGYYYVGVRATGDQGAAPYLTWDDLSITIPCSLNSPTLSVLVPSGPVCQGLPASLQAGGADTYSWSNGTQGPANIVTPLTHSTYVVYGFNSLSGCSTSVSINLSVTPAPAVGAIASDYSVCSGQSVTLTATGADSFYWSTGSTSSVTVITPTVSQTYNLAGTNSTGCTGTTQVHVEVYAVPLIIAKPSSSLICLGESVRLTAQGASSYLWVAPNLYATGNEVTVTPQSSTMYTLTSTTQEGCSVTSQMFVVVDACTGLAENPRNDLRIFPNPATDQLFVQSKDGNTAITITDVSGRVIATQLAAAELTAIDLSNLSAGIYYIRLQTESYNRTEKFIKQ